MNIRLSPSKLSGQLRIIGSKSAAHRAILCAALADKATHVLLGTDSEDIRVTLDAVRNLGASAQADEDGRMTICPIARSSPDETILDCRESGSTLRFLLPIVGAGFAPALFTGAGRLPDRPLEPLLQQMKLHGSIFTADRLPFTLRGLLRGGRFLLPGNISSQFVTGLLMALPLTAEGGAVELTSSAESSGYIDLTIDVLRQFGIAVETRRNLYQIACGAQYRSPGTFEVEGDWSSAAFWLTANALGSDIRCTGLRPDSLQGDKAIVQLLDDLQAKDLGADPFEIDAQEIPDLIPILAVAACATERATRICNAGRLRLKESDRLSAISDGLARLGADIREYSDGLEIQGKPSLRGGAVNGYGDHRIVMALAVASTVCTGEVLIHGAEAVKKSYPAFFSDFQRLGGVADVIDDRKEP